MNRRADLLGAAVAVGLTAAASTEVVTVQNVRKNTLAPCSRMLRTLILQTVRQKDVGVGRARL
jgi:hypothetical protein